MRKNEKTIKSQKKESKDFNNVVEVTLEDHIKMAMNTKSKLDIFIKVFMEDGMSRNQVLAWLRSFGVYYSKLPE